MQTIFKKFLNTEHKRFLNTEWLTYIVMTRSAEHRLQLVKINSALEYQILNNKINVPFTSWQILSAQWLNALYLSQCSTKKSNNKKAARENYILYYFYFLFLYGD
jgi:hypothetical protein